MNVGFFPPLCWRQMNISRQDEWRVSADLIILNENIWNNYIMYIHISSTDDRYIRCLHFLYSSWKIKLEYKMIEEETPKKIASFTLNEDSWNWSLLRKKISTLWWELDLTSQWWNDKFVLLYILPDATILYY